MWFIGWFLERINARTFIRIDNDTHHYCLCYVVFTSWADT